DLERYPPFALPRIATRSEARQGGRNREMRVQSGIVRGSTVNERQPAAAGRPPPQLRFLAKKLLFWWGCCRRDRQRRAHLPRAGLSRRRTRQRSPTSVTLMNPLLRILIVAGVFLLIAPTSRGGARDCHRDPLFAG